MDHNIVQIPRKVAMGKLQPTDVTNSIVNNISWTTDGTSITNRPAELYACHPSQIFSKSTILMSSQ